MKLWKNSFLSFEVISTRLSFNSCGFIYQKGSIEKQRDTSGESLYQSWSRGEKLQKEREEKQTERRRVEKSEFQHKMLVV